jgi:Ca2+-transporting ATPase
VGELPFDANTTYLAIFHTEPDGRSRVHVKGAVDVLLGLCTDVRAEDGVRGLDDEHASASSP